MKNKKRLIDADLLKKAIENSAAESATKFLALIFVNNSKTVDSVEVVHCNDCIHCRHTYNPKSGISHQVCGYVGYNPVQSSQVADDFYCAYGETQEGGYEYENS